MKKAAVFLSILLLTLPLNSTSRKNLLFQIEYTKPIEKTQSLQIVFFSAITPQQAESMLRDFMVLMIKYSPPTVEILGTTWDARGKAEGDEQMIYFPNGKHALVYSPKTKQFTYL